MKFFNRKHLYIPHKLVIILGEKKARVRNLEGQRLLYYKLGKRGVVGHQTGSQSPLGGNMAHV